MAASDDLPPLLTANDFYRVRSLKDLAAFKVIGEVRVHRGFRGGPHCYGQLQHLGLPDEVLFYLNELILPVDDAFQKWYLELSDYFDDPNRNVSHFVAKHGLHWKWCGMIDVEQMAKAFVADETFPIVWRFCVACEYCYVPDIYRLWELMTDPEKLECDNSHRRLAYWTMKLSGTLSSFIENSSECENEFAYGLSEAIFSGNLSAIKYFWDLVGESERNANLVDHACEALEGFLCQWHLVPFFVLKMDRQQQIKVLRYQLLQSTEDALNVHVLLRPPWRHLFLPFLDAITLSSPADDARLQTSLYNILDSYEEILPICQFNLPRLNCEIVTRVWSLLDQNHRYMFFRSRADLLHLLYETGYIRCLKSILSGLTAVDLKEIAMSDKFLDQCYYSVVHRKFESVEFALSHLLPKEESPVILFKEKAAVYFRKMICDDFATPHTNVTSGSIDSVVSNLEKLRKFLNFMDDYLKSIAKSDGNDISTQDGRF